MNREQLKRKDKKQFKCGYCGNEFVRYIGSSMQNSKHSSTSSQVRCDVCLNFLKTNSGVTK